jgi:dephospho-CoA kinase
MFKKDIKIIGIAGKIASGKSYIGNLLRQNNYQVIDVDKVAHEVMELDFVKNKIRDIFGDDVFDGNNVSRKKLGDLVFSDKQMLFTLNQLFFGIVYIRTVEQLLHAIGSVVFIENALLFSMGLDHICNAVIYVDARPHIRLNRMINNRGMTKERALKRLNSQDDLPSSWQDKEHYVIFNDGNKETFEKEVQECLSTLLASIRPLKTQ